jgi:hypothetical protein
VTGAWCKHPLSLIEHYVPDAGMKRKKLKSLCKEAEANNWLLDEQGAAHCRACVDLITTHYQQLDAQASERTTP